MTAQPGWESQAACAGVDVDVFFPRRDDSAAAGNARAICRRCPVIADCLATAIERHEHGVWGGTTDYQRQRMHKRGVA